MTKNDLRRLLKAADVAGKSLKEFKLQFGHLINETSKTTQLGLFNFRAFLNIGMLLTESEKARQVRSVILDIVIATLNTCMGGGTETKIIELCDQTQETSD